MAEEKIDEIEVRPVMKETKEEPTSKQENIEIKQFLSDMQEQGISTAEVLIQRKSMTYKDWRIQKSEILDINSENWTQFLQRILETRGSGEYKFEVKYRNKDGEECISRIYKKLDDPDFPYQPGFDEEVEEEEKTETRTIPETPPSLFNMRNSPLWAEIEEKAKESKDPTQMAMLEMIKNQQATLEMLLHKLTEEKPESTMGQLNIPQIQSQPQPQISNQDMVTIFSTAMTNMMTALATMMEKMKPVPATIQKQPSSDIDNFLKYIQIMKETGTIGGQQKSMTPQEYLQMFLQAMNIGKEVASGKVPEIPTAETGKEETLRNVGLGILKTFGERIGVGAADSISKALSSAITPEMAKQTLQEVAGVIPQQKKEQNPMFQIFEAAHVMLEEGKKQNQDVTPQIAKMLLENLPKKYLIQYVNLDWNIAKSFILQYKPELKNFEKELQKVFLIMKEYIKTKILEKRKEKLTKKKEKEGDLGVQVKKKKRGRPPKKSQEEKSEKPETTNDSAAPSS